MQKMHASICGVSAVCHVSSLATIKVFFLLATIKFLSCLLTCAKTHTSPTWHRYQHLEPQEQRLGLLRNPAQYDWNSHAHESRRIQDPPSWQMGACMRACVRACVRACASVRQHFWFCSVYASFLVLAPPSPPGARRGVGVYFLAELFKLLFQIPSLTPF